VPALKQIKRWKTDVNFLCIFYTYKIQENKRKATILTAQHANNNTSALYSTTSETDFLHSPTARIQQQTTIGLDTLIHSSVTDTWSHMQKKPAVLLGKPT